MVLINESKKKLGIFTDDNKSKFQKILTCKPSNTILRRNKWAYVLHVRYIGLTVNGFRL